MKIPIFQVDAFTSEIFGGNPAAVCMLDRWLDDAILQKIGQENNLSETAFLVPAGNNSYHIRWFTPSIEIDLCGHATLASAFVIFNYYQKGSDSVTFYSLDHVLKVTKKEDLLTLDFPAQQTEKVDIPDLLTEALGIEPIEVHQSRDYVVLLENEEAVKSVKPDFNLLKKLDCLGIIITAPGNNSDFVSRFFAPSAGIDEDPVTGSAHTKLIPYWAAKKGKKKLNAFQVSERVGELFCEHSGDRVLISGYAVLYMEGYIFIE